MKLKLIGFFLDFAGPITLAAFLAWVYFTARYVWPKFQAQRKEWGITALFALAGAVVAFLSATVDFKVLSDETNLLSVANMLAIFGKASNTEMWTYYYHTYHAVQVAVPTRPILFPVLTALVHMVFGVNQYSPFVVNFVCLFGLFFVAAHTARKIFPRFGRALVFFALLMNPALLIVSTSAGFDLCSLFFALLSVVFLQKYLRDREPELLPALIFSVVCFGSVRYESILAIPLLFLGLWWFHGRRLLDWRYYAAALLFVVPQFTQRFLTWGSFENPVGVAPFSLGHFRDHFLPFIRSFFWVADGAYPALLHWLGLGGLWLIFKRLSLVALMPFFYGVFLFFLILCHHFGFADHPTQVRLFLPLTVGLSLLGLYFVADRKLPEPWLLGLFVLLFAHYHQYTLHDPLSTQLTMTREVRHIRDFLKVEGKPSDLYVYDRPGQLMALGLSAVSWDHYRQNEDELLKNVKNRLYDRLIFIERVPYAGETPAELALDRPKFSLTPLVEHQLSPAERLRLARAEIK